MILNINSHLNKLQLVLVFLIVLLVFINYEFLPFIVPIFISLCYLKIIRERNILDVLILIITSRVLMGFVVIKNDFSFNVINVLCNYLPVFMFLLLGSINKNKVKNSFLKSYKWTLSYTLILIILCFYNLKYSITEFPQQVLPMIFFTFVCYHKKIVIDTSRVINFFRVLFLANLIPYFIPGYTKSVYYLMNEGIVFKESMSIPLGLTDILFKNVGFTFDWRILGQFAIIYLLFVIVKSDNKRNWWDHLLIIFTLLTSFSRGPIIIALLIYSLFLYRIYFSINFKKKIIQFIIPFSLLLTISIYFVSSNQGIITYLSEYNVLNEKNAISQRGGFSSYALDKAKGNIFFGLGIGNLSSLNANNYIDLGYTDITQVKKVYYSAVVDAYWALSIAEKGIIGTIFFVLSFLEIFYRKKNYYFLLLTFGLFINLIGTDIPKEGMFYFAILIFLFHINPKVSSINEKI